MEHVLWIGGPPGAGKTTIASRLARRHGLRLYSTDTRTWEHRDRAICAGNQAAVRWEQLTPEERWSGSSDELLAMSLHVERGPMALDDVSRLPPSPLVLAEGSPVSAGLVADSACGVWLVPTREFRRARLEERRLEAGATALYERIAAEIERQVREHVLPVLQLDGQLSPDEIADAVERHFAAALAAGPLAATRDERRRLVREANAAIVSQVRSYYERAWTEGDAAASVRTFACECGGRRCQAEVELAIGAFDDGPVLAPGH